MKNAMVRYFSARKCMLRPTPPAFRSRRGVPHNGDTPFPKIAACRASCACNAMAHEAIHQSHASARSKAQQNPRQPREARGPSQCNGRTQPHLEVIRRQVLCAQEIRLLKLFVAVAAAFQHNLLVRDGFLCALARRRRWRVVFGVFRVHGAISERHMQRSITAHAETGREEGGSRNGWRKRGRNKSNGTLMDASRGLLFHSRRET